MLIFDLARHGWVRASLSGRTFSPSVTAYAPSADLAVAAGVPVRRELTNPHDHAQQVGRAFGNRGEIQWLPETWVPKWLNSITTMLYLQEHEVGGIPWETKVLLVKRLHNDRALLAAINTVLLLASPSAVGDPPKALEALLTLAL